MRRLLRTGTGRDTVLWPVLLLLLVVLVPTAGVVWMMRAAMDNERLAVRQRLTDVYHNQLELAARRIEADRQRRLAEIDAIAHDGSPGEVFERLVTTGAADGAIVFDHRGRLAYPSRTAEEAPPEPRSDPRWEEAQRAEFIARDFAGAAAIYRVLSVESDDPQRINQARQALARCQLRLGNRDEAITVLEELRRQENAVDALGRSLPADAEFRLLEVLDRSGADWVEIAAALVERLNRYTAPSLPPEQRRFLMHEVQRLAPQATFPTLAAEEMAAEIIAAAGGGAGEPTAQGLLRATTVAGLWRARASGGRVLVMYRTETLRIDLDRAIAEQPSPVGVSIAIRDPALVDEAGDIASLSLGPRLPGWRLALTLDSEKVFDATGDDRSAFLLWTAVVVVVVTVALALLVVGGLRRQMCIARLKNDLVATVSHELKTPLASIRLLVDTLLEEHHQAPHSIRAVTSPDARAGVADELVATSDRNHEYLQLIAQENQRLSRLIDNFLTFSRMDRGKHRFDIQPIDAVSVVSEAVKAVSDRFQSVQADLQIDVGPPLPVLGDRDALVTAVVNLLDNAYKYTGENKQVSVAAHRSESAVRIVVADNGVGLSPRGVRRVFDRFFQVDQRLSRVQGGCGLGLSIVRFIVEAHGGRVTVESRLGEGSKFTVTLPVDVNAESAIVVPLEENQPRTANR